MEGFVAAANFRPSYLISLCAVCFLHFLQNLLSSSLSGFSFLFLVEEYPRSLQIVHSKMMTSCILLYNFCHYPSADRMAAFAYGEAQFLFERYRGD